MRNRGVRPPDRIGNNILYPVKEREGQVATDELGFERSTRSEEISLEQGGTHEGLSSEGSKINPRTPHEDHDEEEEAERSRG